MLLRMGTRPDYILDRDVAMARGRVIPDEIGSDA